ncbi:hypothetical protein HETIRDRAFT_454177 [Heterobasidion irregulare TC 32-1]|uniref:AB hydrolase-1 domain-containing protein n=1 Tax=Heterobasidion irregulare (strain TC 32-1) TaxID=747525 RepID=W4JXF6_HETIT|nr:uncharacterized protein HETIRDRAFT_454177 [Heterobasidion irregulare TC 32-1]ETW78144.1 hypothetical protein HETIRDRAFT_454177 [Heterobasidion irregulare TC 32-1]
MFPFAAAHRLRLVAVNQRDYRNSTPLSEEDLALLRSEDDDRRTEYFRRISEDGKEEGEIVLVGWPSGNTVVRPLFAYAYEAPEDLKDALEPYMRAYGLYDVPRRLCGFPDIAGFFRPFPDNSELPPAQQLASFETWMSGYYSHPYVMSRDLKCLMQQLQMNVALGKPPTLCTMTPEDKMAVMDPAAVQDHEMFINSMPHDVYLRGILGKCVTGAWDLADSYDEKAKGEVTRAMITTSSRANHFIHWDEPEKVASVFANFL